MANESVTGSGAGAAALVAQVASRAARLLLADRANLRNHPALVNLGEDLVGATELKGSLLGLNGYDEFASRTEIQAVTNTAVSSATYTCAPGRYSLARGTSDYLRMVDPTGAFDEIILAQSMVFEYAMLFTTEIAKIGDGFTTVGTSGTDYTHDRWLATQFALKQANVPGPYLNVMSTESFTQWQADLEQRGGLTQWRPASTDMQMLRGTGFEGSYNGIEVFTTDRVQKLNTDADWANFMFGRGAIGFKELPPAPPTRDMSVLLTAGPLLAESARNATEANSQVVGNAWVGFSAIETGRGRVGYGAAS